MIPKTNTRLSVSFITFSPSSCSISEPKLALPNNAQKPTKRYQGGIVDLTFFQLAPNLMVQMCAFVYADAKDSDTVMEAG